MRFSLVVATKNRVDEVDRFLRSLIAQTHRDFEVIVVDQNSDDRLIKIMNSYQELLTITHLQTSKTGTKSGTSRARNQGRLLAQGEIIAYPDDDCLYPPDLLAKIASFFEINQAIDGLTVRVMDLDSDNDAFDYCLEQSGKVNYFTAWSLGIGPSMFFRSKLAKTVSFDEEMGPGALWVGGEDTDYLLHCLDQNADIYYNVDLFVRHPRPYAIYTNRQLVWREFTYGRGFGYLLRKRNVSLPIVLQQLFEPIILFAKYSMTGNFRYALSCPSMGFGRVLGYWEGTRKFSNRTEL